MSNGVLLNQLYGQKKLTQTWQKSYDLIICVYVTKSFKVFY